MSECSKCQSNSCVCNTIKVKGDFPCIDLTCLHVDLFGSPYNCKKQILTPLYSSPNSPLPPKELERLQRCIEEANDILRYLGAESNPDNRRQLQLHFLSIRGANIILKIHCEGQQEIDTVSRNSKKYFKSFSKKEVVRKLSLKMKKGRKTKRAIIEINGKISTAGRDFIQVNQVGASVFVFYNRLISIAGDECEHVKQPEQELIDIDRKTRRELAFNFGSFVSKNPELVNLFFGNSLFKQLKGYLGDDIKVRTFNKEVIGTLVKVDKATIHVLKKNDKELAINLDEICFVKVFNLK